MKPFNIAQVLADAGVNNDTSARKQIEYIPIGQIEADPGNFYDLPKLEELANSISIIGLQEPVVVRPVEDGRYRIISGHRRTAALRILIDRGEHDDKVMCIVERQQESEALTQLKLIMGNSENRVLTSAEQARQVEETQQLIYQLKQEGFDFPGRVRDYVSDICKISTGKAANTHPPRGGTYILGQPPRNVKEELTLTCTKLISMTGFLVRYVDLREPKPRTIHESVHVMEKDALAALGLMGLNVLDFITTRFQRGGYLVIGIAPAKPKRVAEIDLCQLWEQSAPPATTGESEDAAQ